MNVSRLGVPVLLSLVMLLGLLAGPGQAQKWPDLTQGILDDYDITEAQVEAISQGFEDGSWRPYQGITRAQFVKMAVDRFGLQLLNPASPSFQDIPRGHQYYRYIETAYTAGMITGVGDGYFAPGRIITRAQGAAIIVRYLAALRGTTTEALYGPADIERILEPFAETPVEIGAALADEMAAAVDWGVLRGTGDSRLEPRRSLARVQGAALLVRADIPETQDVEVHLYFSHEGEIATVHRTVTVGPSLEVGAATLNQLFAGVSQGERAELMSEIPQGTQLIGLNISNRLATIDLDGDFVAPGSPHSLRMRVAQVVYTLTQFPTVDQVSFRVAGQPLESLGGVDLSQPVGRPGGVDEPFEALTPAIFVESPAFFDEISSPVRLRGTANVFEATFVFEIRDQNGNVLAEDFVTASAGTGTRGTFDVTVPYDQPATRGGTIVVYSQSARDGSPENVIEIPVLFTE